MEEMQYALISKNKLTEDEVLSGISEMRWAKHKEIREYTSNEVVLTWSDSFFYKKENPITWEPWLRQPQIGAIYSIMGHLQLANDSAIVVLPTWTWKTETMLSVLIAQQIKKLLVIVPSDSLRWQISDKFITLGLLKKFGIVSPSIINPKVAVLSSSFKDNWDVLELLAEANVIVGTMAVFDKFSPDQLVLLQERISTVYIDEAHHVKAKSWNDFKNNFKPWQIVQFTATPFRNDGKRLDGKIIFNFPLSEAQKQGYFKEIKFFPISEWDNDLADKKIAEKAIEKLRENDKHILMARCETSKRAEEVFNIYKNYTEFNPVIIHSHIKKIGETYKKILDKKTRIIVCVDMLGEGFDLPELKVAAFHDIRKSLPITLQFVWRFTRSKYDDIGLWNASFIANIANPDVKKELTDLYSRDADWNDILSDVSYMKTKDEESYKKFMSWFQKLGDSKIPFQNIKLKLSTVAYKTTATEWQPENFKIWMKWYDKIEDKLYDINEDEKILIIITANKSSVDWVNHKDIYKIDWDITTVFWDEDNGLLFINSSNNGSTYLELAQAIMGNDIEPIRGIDVFKTFYNITRIRMQNVWLRQHIWRWTSFRSFFGSDVSLSRAEKERSEKAYVMWYWYEEWNKVTIGASTKWRIWTKKEDELRAFKDWCLQIWSKLVDKEIDPNQILKDTLMPKQILTIPDTCPTFIEWDEGIYDMMETRIILQINDKKVDLTGLDIKVGSVNETRDKITFYIECDEERIEFEMFLFENKTNTSNCYPDYKISLLSAWNIYINIGSRSYLAVEYFQNNPPTVWLSSGSSLRGNEYIEIIPYGYYDKDSIIAWDWLWVDISKESQWVFPLVENSIQYYAINKLLTEGDYDIIYDDDNSWEMADIITMKKQDDVIKMQLFHLKYAKDGVISNRIDNLYEVCWQAQKSVHWKHRKWWDIAVHMLKRIEKKKWMDTRNRLEKGSQETLEKLLGMVKKDMRIEFEVFIVQPSISKNSVTEPMLTLLGVTESHLNDIGNIKFKVIGSS